MVVTTMWKRDDNKQTCLKLSFTPHFQNTELCPGVYIILCTACSMDITAFFNNVSGHYKLEINVLYFLANFDNPMEESWQEDLSLNSLSFSLLEYKSYVLVVPRLVYTPYSMGITAFVNNVSGHYKLPRDDCTTISAYFQQSRNFSRKKHTETWLPKIWDSKT